MPSRHVAALRPIDPTAERRQREHELNQALEAARRLQARLEMLGDRATDVAVVVSLRDSLARDLQALGAPQIVLATDDVDGDGQPNEWNAYWAAQAAGEVDR